MSIDRHIGTNQDCCKSILCLSGGRTKPTATNSSHATIRNTRHGDCDGSFRGDFRAVGCLTTPADEAEFSRFCKQPRSSSSSKLNKELRQRHDLLCCVLRLLLLVAAIVNLQTRWGRSADTESVPKGRVRSSPAPIPIAHPYLHFRIRTLDGALLLRPITCF